MISFFFPSQPFLPVVDLGLLLPAHQFVEDLVRRPNVGGHPAFPRVRSEDAAAELARGLGLCRDVGRVEDLVGEVLQDQVVLEVALRRLDLVADEALVDDARVSVLGLAEGVEYGF